MRLGLGVLWGVLAARPFMVRARKVGPVQRVRGLRVAAGGASVAGPTRTRLAVRRVRVGARLPGPGGRLLAILKRVADAPGRARRARAEADALAGDVATAVDLVAVAVSAGCTPYLAVELGARWCPPRVGAELAVIVRACAVGTTFDDAAAEAARRRPAVRPLLEVLRTSARLGTAAGPALDRLGAESRADLRRRAEARARTVPVRLCLPLVGCILPAFALLTVVPVVLDGLRP
ncbi:MAG: type II secretion system F family protein [Actinomycetota bacterium]